MRHIRGWEGDAGANDSRLGMVCGCEESADENELQVRMQCGCEGLANGNDAQVRMGKTCIQGKVNVLTSAGAGVARTQHSAYAVR